jgi:hypothetical protein
MEKVDPRLFKVWSLAFRTWSFVVMIFGSLAALVGAAMTVAALIPSVHAKLNLSFWGGIFIAVMGVLVAMTGSRGMRIRKQEDLAADMDQTAKDRDRFENWINR